MQRKGHLSSSVPEWDRQFRLVRIHHEHREELGRLGLAGIGADAVAVAGQFGEALSSLVGGHRSVVDLTSDRPLKHSRVDECGFGMRVAGRVAAGAVFDEHALDALAGERSAARAGRQGSPWRSSPSGLPRGRCPAAGWRQVANRGCVSWSQIFRLMNADQAPAWERRSHSSKPMRPRRASPNGTSECSWSRLPQYWAAGSFTTSRGSPTAFR